MEWYYSNESDQQITFEESEFQTLVREGKITPSTLVWNEALPDWKEAAHARPDLFPVASPSPYSNPPAIQQGPPAIPTTVPQDGLAVTALVCGILSFFGIFCIVFAFVPSIAAIICGHISRKKIRNSEVPIGGNGMALAGLICGYVTMGLWIAWIVIYAGMMIWGISMGGFETPLE